MLFYMFIIILVICTIVLTYNYFDSNDNILNKFKTCKWKVIQPRNMSIDEEYVNTTKYINILNELNIFYYLAFGSELAAYRDGNKRKDDHDIDVNIPVWKNYNIFHCNYYEKLNDSLFYNKNVHLYENYTVCGKNRKYYIDIMEQYLLNQWKKYEVKINTNPLSMHVYLYYNPTSFPLHYDFSICLSNEYVYRDLNLCVSHFQNTLAIVPSDPHPHLQLLYGNYLVPSYRQSSEGYNIHSPDTT